MLRRVRQIWLRLRSLGRPGQLDRDLEEEIAFHLAMREQSNRGAGLDATEARYAARRQFGNATLAKDQAALANAKTDLQRYSKLLQQNFTPEQQYATQVSTVAQDEAAGKNDEAAIKAAQLNVDYASIKSPIDGVTAPAD